eukprot:TRINITY_DN10279_c0_g1_i3.p1 TRINITY_DN10279_c0_g1~~TRINITY_DN10279_c0_g1_i3.p1  ORF type:complete len:513 (+),score=134.25 TRINITY_DN10279_c0_g1_i3:73-1611(+)
MSLLQQILETMYIDPDLLEELTKDQKEILFHKMREEQIRRWHTRKSQQAEALAQKQKAPARLKFAPKVHIFEDQDLEKRAAESAKRLAQAEAEREKVEMKQDEQQAKVLAEIAIQEEIARQTAEQARKAEELRLREEDEKRQLAAAAEAERLAAIERETYMTMKEARLAAEKEAKAQAEREAHARKLAEQRKQEEARLEEERKRAEQAALRQAEAKQQEIYLSMRGVREAAKRAREEEEKRMDAMYAAQEKAAREAEAQQKAAAERARKQAQQDAERATQYVLDLTSRLALLGDTIQLHFACRSILAKLAERKASSAPDPTAKATNIARSSSLNQSPAPPRPSRNALPLPPRSFRGKPASGGSAPAATPRPSKPANEAAVIAWLNEEELPRGAGRSATGRYEPWFHGVISRGEAEALLRGQPVGAFLLRVSTRIWGYTLSFVDSDRYKHFLVDASDGKYSVFGAQTNHVHTSLSTMIAFHKKMAVSKTGTVLSVPVGDPRGNPSLAKITSTA